MTKLVCSNYVVTNETSYTVVTPLVYKKWLPNVEAIMFNVCSNQ